MGLSPRPHYNDLWEDCGERDNLVRWSFLEDVEFVSLCLDGGPGLLFSTIFTCTANEHELSCSVEILGDGSEFDQQARHCGVVETGDCYWRQEGDVLEIGVARVIGPFRKGVDTEDFVVTVLRDLIAHLIETAEDFGPDVTSLIEDIHPSPESCLERAVAAIRESDHPLAGHFVELLQIGTPMAA